MMQTTNFIEISIKRIPNLAFSILIFLVGCYEGDTNYKQVKFKDLPLDVQEKFLYVYDYVDTTDPNFMPDFIECHNLSENCTCEIEMKYGSMTTLVIPQKIVLESCGQKAEIPFSVVERVFILKEGLVYYPHTHKILLAVLALMNLVQNL